MRRSASVFGLLLLAATASASGPGRAAGVPFLRTVADANGPGCPCGKAWGDLDGDGRPDLIVAGSDGPLVGYASPGWFPAVIAAGGYDTEGGLAAADLDQDGDLDVTVGAVWFENPRQPGPATAPWAVHRLAAQGDARKAPGGGAREETSSPGPGPGAPSHPGARTW